MVERNTWIGGNACTYNVVIERKESSLLNFSVCEIKSLQKMCFLFFELVRLSLFEKLIIIIIMINLFPSLEGIPLTITQIRHLFETKSLKERTKWKAVSTCELATGRKSVKEKIEIKINFGNVHFMAMTTKKFVNFFLNYEWVNIKSFAIDFIAGVDTVQWTWHLQVVSGRCTANKLNFFLQNIQVKAANLHRIRLALWRVQVATCACDLHAPTYLNGLSFVRWTLIVSVVQK